jgi:acyl-[acyl-carrier-protein] desaturase
MRDTTGADATASACWIRGWSAEENRHGDVLNRYMYLSDRFDMREVEHTVQRLIRNGMTVRAPASPFHGFVYVAFQERTTAIAHGNMARHVGARGGAGDTALTRIRGASTCRPPSSTTAATAASTSTLASSPSRSRPARTRFPTTVAS